MQQAFRADDRAFPDERSGADGASVADGGTGFDHHARADVDPRRDRTAPRTDHGGRMNSRHERRAFAVANRAITSPNASDGLSTATSAANRDAAANRRGTRTAEARVRAKLREVFLVAEETEVPLARVGQ